MKIFLFLTSIWILSFYTRYITDGTSWEPYGKLTGPICILITLIYVWRHLDDESQ